MKQYFNFNEQPLDHTFKHVGTNIVNPVMEKGTQPGTIGSYHLPYVPLNGVTFTGSNATPYIKGNVYSYTATTQTITMGPANFGLTSCVYSNLNGVSFGGMSHGPMSAAMYSNVGGSGTWRNGHYSSPFW